MLNRTLHMKTVVELKRIAKEENIKLPSHANKAQMVEIIEKHIQQKAVGVAAEFASENAQPESLKPENQNPENAQAESESLTEERQEAEQSAEAQSPEQKVNAPRREVAFAPRGYQRPMSTQQRMGARTQPVQGNYRKAQQGGAAPRFNTETNLSRPQRAFESTQPNRRAMGDTPRYSQQNGENAQPGRRTMGDTPRYPQSNGENAQPIRRTMGDTPRYPQSNGENAPRRNVGTENLPYNDERLLNQGVPELLSAGECGDGAGILEIHPDGYGFLRAENYLPGNNDVYVSAAQIRRFNLRTGDYVVGKTRPQQMGDRSVGLIFLSEINGQSPDLARKRRPFDSLVPVYPNERLRMERSDTQDLSLRLIDVLAPIGKGQRGMIVSPPKAGKTTLLKKVANAITTNNPEVHLIVLLIDERPEEVTDMKRSIEGEVVYSTFDEAPENHTRVSEMVLERAQRLVELGKDVVILLDSITRLARAYNLVIPPTGRSLSGGLDPGALYRPKRFFGAARNIENGGSLTIIATALVDTGSRMDDIIYEEFKGTGNMELHLDRSLSDRRIFPAMDMYRSGTRREELLLTKEELDGSYQVRRMLSKGSPQETAEQLIQFMEKTKNNMEFFQRVKGWTTAFEKDGMSLRR